MLTVFLFQDMGESSGICSSMQLLWLFTDRVPTATAAAAAVTATVGAPASAAFVVRDECARPLVALLLPDRSALRVFAIGSASSPSPPPSDAAAFTSAIPSTSLGTG